MDKYFKKTKLKELRPGLKQEIFGAVRKELSGQALPDSLKFMHLYWSLITAAFAVLILLNIYTNIIHENLMVKEYSACASADTECKYEIIRIAEAQGMFSIPILRERVKGGPV